MRAALALTIGLLAAASAAADTIEARASAQVPASPERVLSLLADFESWNRVFESVETVRAERQDERRARLRQRVRRAGFTLGYTLAATVDPIARRVDLVLDPNEPSDVELLTTSWRVDPLPGGGSLVSLCVVTRTHLPVPHFLERRIAEGTAHDSLAELVRALDRVATSVARVGEG